MTSARQPTDGTGRIACLYVPLFPLAARLRSEPELGGEAVAIFEGNGTAARLVAASRRGRLAGLQPGQTVAQARALVPNLIQRGRDELCEHAARQALLEIAEAHSPRVEDAGEGAAYLDLAGLERHFSEADLGHALSLAVERTGLVAWIGIASSKLAARIAAEQPEPATIVPAGDEARFLAPLPLVWLCDDAAVLETLQRWGLRSIGELARLPADDLTSRLGPMGQELHRQANGLDTRPLVPRQTPPTFDEGMELEWPLTRLEPFLFVARAALDRLSRRLQSCGLACIRLETRLALEPEGHLERAVHLPSPTTDVKTLLTLLRLDLEGHPPGAPVAGFTLTASPDRPRAAQLSLFGPAALAPDQLATTLARLFAILGPDRVGSPETRDGHRPERAALAAFAPPPPPEIAEAPRRSRGLLTVRVLRPPLPLEVIVDGGPCQIRPAIGAEGGKLPRIQGTVKVSSGPWRLEAEWWQADAAERDYWDVELSDGGLYRIYLDRRSGDWFADGLYD